MSMISMIETMHMVIMAIFLSIDDMLMALPSFTIYPHKFFLVKFFCRKPSSPRERERER